MKNIFRRTIVVQLAVIFCAAFFTFLIFALLSKNSFINQTNVHLISTLESFKGLLVKERLLPKQLCSSLNENSKYRLTIVGLTGEVLCDSTVDAQSMDNHGKRAEIVGAMKTGQGMAIRFSNTLQTDMIYRALQLTLPKKNQKLIIRLAMPLDFLEHFLQKAQHSTFFILVPVFMILSIFSTIFILKSDEKRKRKEEKLKIDLVANISHEVRTPLTALKGYVQVLKSLSNNLEREQLNYLDKIEHNAERLTTLFRDVLDLSNLENNQRLSFEILSVNEITEKIISSLGEVHKKKEISVSYDTKIDHFEGNGKTIEQLLNNLVDNAFKYTAKGGKISIGWDKIDSYAQLTVKDNGIGIPEKDRNRIFERFFRIDGCRSREMGGTGLGLAIVKHVIQRHNGKVWFESVPDQGTTFYVQLPMKQSMN